MITGIIIAGGQSRRLGYDKRQLRLWGAHGPTLLEQTVATLAPLCAEVVVVLNDPEAWRHLPVRLVPDCVRDAGALGGLAAGLAAITTPRALVVAADMPFLQPTLLQALVDLPCAAQVLIPRAPTTMHNRAGLEPLHAIYDGTCLPTLRAALDRGERRLVTALSSLTRCVVETATWMRYDPQGRAFFNLNTPADLALFDSR